MYTPHWIDEIGPWSEIKLAIVKEYAAAYSTILAAHNFHHVYIDAFAGTGYHMARTDRELVDGSPVNALRVKPPFREYHFIDLIKDKVTSLRELADGHPDVRIYQGDANIVLRELFPTVRYEEYKRALCLLDPYGLHYRWDVIALAGQMSTIEIFLNFSVQDANRNVLRKNPDEIDPAQAQRLTLAWGDDSWRQIAYTTEGSLFGFENKVTNDELARAYQTRLQKVAGFSHVPDPLAVHNSKGTVIFYLYFAAQRPVAAHIVEEIFRKYRAKGV